MGKTIAPPAVPRTWWDTATRAMKAATAAIAGVTPLATPTHADVFAALDAPRATFSSTLAETAVGPFRFGSPVAHPNLVDTVTLKDHTGKVVFDTGIRPYTRSYAAATQGPLRFAHGSKAPTSIALSSSEHDALLRSTPGQALDRMAAAAGASGVAFERMATSPDFYDPQRPTWWGLCAQWSYTSLNRAINAKVDIDGDAGARGLWLHGEWMSRADLGNWAMAVSRSFVNLAVMETESQTLGGPSPRDLVAMLGALRDGGPGVIIDVFNDKHHGRAETWNQPLVKADVVQLVLPAATEQKVLELAAKDGWKSATSARVVSITGTYGIEVTDDYEGPPATKSSTWNVVVAKGADDTVLWAWLVDDPRLADAGLPITKTDPLPDYIARVSQRLADSAVHGVREPAFDIHKYGAEMTFFLGTVLKDGVTGKERTAFEQDVLGRVDATRSLAAADVAALRAAHPGVAHAYTAAQWEKTFAALGLTLDAFRSP